MSIELTSASPVRRRTRIIKSATLLAAAAVLFSACGTTQAAPPVETVPSTIITAAPSDAPDTTIEAPKAPKAPEAPEAPQEPEQKVATPTPVAPTVPTAAVCDDVASPFGQDYNVVGIKANDPDGGLVVRTAAGSSNSPISVLVQGTTVSTSANYDDCREFSNGAVWWKIQAGSTIGWVNANYLGQSEAQGDQSLAAMCGLFDQVMAFEFGPVNGVNFPPADLLNSFETALQMPPAGIYADIDQLRNPTDAEMLQGAFDGIRGYVGGICS